MDMLRMFRPKDIILKRTKVLQEDVEYVPFERFLGRDIRILSIMGLRSMKSIFTDNIVKFTMWEVLEFGIFLLNYLYLVCATLIMIIETWSDDWNNGITTAAVMLDDANIVLKGCRIFFWREELHKLLRQFAIMWDNSQLRIRIKDENVKIAAETYYSSKLYMIMFFLIWLTYTAKPFVLLAEYQWNKSHTNASYDYSVGGIYGGIHPGMFKVDTMSKYLLFLFWEQISLIISILYCISADVLFAQLTTHTAIQFRVLRHDLEYVTDINNHDGDDDDDDTFKYENIYIDRLSTIAKRHRDLYTYCEIIESMYNPVIFVTMLITGIIMCFGAFHLQKAMSEKNFFEAMKSLSHTSTVVIQAFVYCNYADKLTEESSLMAAAAYECQWMGRSKNFNIILLQIMMRSQRAFNYTAYGFFFVNIAQMTVITKAAGSYFTLLNTVA